MKMQSWLSSAGALGLMSLLFLTPQTGAAQNGRTALPGTINFIEGQVSINGNLFNSRQEGNVSLQPNDMLSTTQGKVEVLLSPGAFLRVGSNSQVRMVSAGMSDPTIEVIRGEAMVEVDFLPKLAHLDVLERGADSTLMKEGLYRFNADQGSVSVFDGKTQIKVNDRVKELGKGHEVLLTEAKLKSVSFDTKAADELYRWSSARAGYLAEANESSARTVYVAGGWGPYGYGPGWAWNPYFATWAWLPYDGFFWSPFGYPFFSPGFVAYAPYYGFGHGFYGGRGFYPGRAGIAAAPAFRGGGFARGGGFGGGFARGGGGRR